MQWAEVRSVCAELFGGGGEIGGEGALVDYLRGEEGDGELVAGCEDDGDAGGGRGRENSAVDEVNCGGGEVGDAGLGDCTGDGRETNSGVGVVGVGVIDL